MRRAIVPLASIILTASLVRAAGAAMSAPADPREVFQKADFEKLLQFEQLPTVVRRNLLERLRSREPEFASHMADPGQEFNPTDVVDTIYPMRRLVFAGAAPGVWFAYYEHGGRGFHYHLLIYEKGRQDPVFAGRFVTRLQHGHVEPAPASVDELKRWLQAGRINDDAAQNNDW